MSPRARLIGALCLAATFVGLDALLVAWRGLAPATCTALAFGTLLGLGSLVLEIQMIERAMRTKSGDVANATFQSFAMRLVLVAPTTFWFSRDGSGVDHTGFAVAYLVTFFVYLCWLTWKTYHAPVQYKAKRSKPFTPRVVEKSRVCETGARR